MPPDEVRCDLCEQVIPPGVGRYTDGQSLVVCVPCNGASLRTLLESRDAVQRREAPGPPES